MAVNGFNNIWTTSLAMPGFGGMPVNVELRRTQRFAHGANDWVQWPNLSWLEQRMLRAMNIITDKPHWDTDIFDDEIVREWKIEEQELQFGSSEKAWDWCLAELRDKATSFQQTRYILVHNTGCGIVKSDSLVNPKLQAELKQNIIPLLNQLNAERDLQSPSCSQVHDLVDPSLFPLVFGRSRLLMNDLFGLESFVGLNQIGVHRFGVQSPVQDTSYDDRSKNDQKKTRPYLCLMEPFWVTDRSCRPYWSRRFQWLPCDVQFMGESDTDVQIVSYINNLHPLRYRPLYDTIEKLISLSIEPWNEVLVKADSCGRLPTRMRTWEAQWDPEFPEWANWDRITADYTRTSPQREALVSKVKEYLEISDDEEFLKCLEKTRRFSGELKKAPDGCENITGRDLYFAVQWKHRCQRQSVSLEPGTAYSYDDWKKGDVGGVKSAYADVFSNSPIWEKYVNHDLYSVKLQENYRDQGLQIVVKLCNIDLTPDDPEFPGEDWHIEGMLNDHIVATVVYCYDQQNTSQTRIHFRQVTNNRDRKCFYEEKNGNLHAVVDPLEVKDRSKLCMGKNVNVQELGSVDTAQGRLLVWPNTLQNRLGRFKLVDPTCSGHYRFIVLYLVDPNYRVCSTRNIPPQQTDFFPSCITKMADHVPQGLVLKTGNNDSEGMYAWGMSIEEATKAREELLEEKRAADEFLRKSFPDSRSDTMESEVDDHSSDKFANTI